MCLDLFLSRHVIALTFSGGGNIFRSRTIYLPSINDNLCSYFSAIKVALTLFQQKLGEKSQTANLLKIAEKCALTIINRSTRRQEH